jgi:hypothetical protein
MTDYAGLKAEIALPKYGGMTDAQIAAQLTTPMTVAVDASAKDARLILMRSATHDWAKLTARSRTTPVVGDPQDWSDEYTAITLVTALQSDIDVLRTSIPEELSALQTQLAVFVANGDIAQANADAIFAMTQAQTTRAQQLGFDPAIHNMEQEIAAARKWGT